MDERDRELIEEAAEVELRLWHALMRRVSAAERQMLQLYQSMQFERLWLEGLMRVNPNQDLVEARESLEKNVAAVGALLQEEVAAVA